MAEPPRIFKYHVPVDGADHTVDVRGPIVFVASQQARSVQFWVIDYPENPSVPYAFRAIGAGQPIPDGMVHVGSSLDGPFVWHLFRRAG